ncbi:MAG: hypothetical protein Unbinned5350contig1004_18 [Prokaryotic dsDNA virus sp.]|nr:MAG: hypothetical protein Unbinned5350contig1004_18 [Prokaryotic dsDNA virus sp.]|tara:strand:+ start:6832 stop:7002 length:171 start_codon:yes stop_codon:yes gene_type:complete
MKLKVGPTYNMGAFDNKFIVLAITKNEAWIRWVDDNETEIVDINADYLVTNVTSDL